MKSRISSLFPGIMMLFTVFLWAGSTVAAPPSLKGDYAFTGEAGCLISPDGFNTDLTPMGPSFIRSSSVQGVRTFNRDGTGTVTGTLVSTSYARSSTFVPSASSETFSFSFLYSVAPDGTFTSDLVPGTYLGTFVAGPLSGDTVTVDKIHLKGMISKDGTSLTLATDAPMVETDTISNGDVEKQICHRSRVLIWLGK